MRDECGEKGNNLTIRVSQDEKNDVPVDRDRKRIDARDP